MAVLLLATAAAADAQAKFIVMASTTSTEQSGLFGHPPPVFKQATGISMRVVTLGTDQALDRGRRGYVDVVFMHEPAAEEKFVAEGRGLKRLPVMYNDFVLIGPRADPAGVRGADVAVALKKLVAANAAFISRGDQSGTLAAEQRYWKLAGIDIAAGKPAGYEECGCGMGPALNMASATDAYVLADRGTRLNFKNRGELVVRVAGDQRLFNQYGVMAVNPAKHPHVKIELAQVFVDWVVSSSGQTVIASFKNSGEQRLFRVRIFAYCSENPFVSLSALRCQPLVLQCKGEKFLVRSQVVT